MVKISYREIIIRLYHINVIGVMYADAAYVCRTKTYDKFIHDKHSFEAIRLNRQPINLSTSLPIG